MGHSGSLPDISTMERDKRSDGFDPQAVLHDFHIQTGSPTGYDMLQQLQQEGHEVYKEIDGLSPDEINSLNPEVKKRLAKEVGDVIIAGLGWFDVEGVDFEHQFWSTVSIMIEKYPPGLINQIMSEENLCRAEAMAKAKTIYESRTS